MPARDEMPETIRRSSAKAQRTWAKTHDSAVRQYGEGEIAHRTAIAALKRTFEKKAGRWVHKSEPGPSDPRSTRPTRAKRHGVGETFGGVDLFGNTKRELYERAARLGIEGRSRMTKVELARALGKKE